MRALSSCVAQVWKLRDLGLQAVTSITSSAGTLRRLLEIVQVR
jgi:hypothetical protein